VNQIVEKKKTGRPSKYSKSIIKNILERLAKGESIRAVIKEENISWNTFRKWMNDDEQLRKDYETAKSDGIQFTIDDIEQLCKSTYSKALDKQVDLNAIKSLDILVRHKHFMASKLSPRTFGSDKQQVTLQNNRGEKFQIEWSK